MKRRWMIWTCLLGALFATRGVNAQILDGGQPSVDDGRLHAWYDAAEFIGGDGDPSTPVWPNKQGEIDRSIWGGWGPSDDSALDLITMENGLPAVQYTDVVTWSEDGQFGTVSDSFTVFVTATVRDVTQAYFFTGNQGGGGAEANANYQVDEFDTWSMKGDLDRILTAPVEADVLQYHAFTFSEDGIGRHHINGQLVGEGEIGLGSLQGLVLGGRQNGFERSGIDFAEVLIYSEELMEADRQAIEGYLEAKYFGSGLVGDFNQDGELNAPDIDDLTAQSASGANDLTYDLNDDSLVNEDDVQVWVKELFNSWMGDANLDGKFSSTDLVQVLAAGTYELDVPAVWSSGDFNGDARTNSTDLVVALGDGGYELGPRAAVAAVPEPACVALFSMALPLLARRLRRRV